MAGRSTERPDLSDHYFSDAPSGPAHQRSVPLDLPGMHLDLVTAGGVFSGDRIDPGTKLLLLDGPPTPAGAQVLDLGCGYGPIAVALAVRGGPDVTLWATDVNGRARDLCRTNAEATGVAGRVHVVSPDDLPGEVGFDQIWSNPPIRIGKAKLHVMLLDALGRLTADGTAHLVVQKHLGADSLAEWLADSGWPTRRTTSRGGYRLLEVRRP